MKKSLMLVMGLLLAIGVRATSVSNLGVTNVTTNSATAVFNVASLSSNTLANVYYGNTDGGTNIALWSQVSATLPITATGVYSVALTGLPASSFVMCSAVCSTNGQQAWGRPSYAFWTRSPSSLPSNPTNSSAVLASTNGLITSHPALEARMTGTQGMASYASNQVDVINALLTPAVKASATSIVVDARAQANVIISALTNDLVMAAPTNAFDGRRISWRMTAADADRAVQWPTNVFRIPASSSMPATITISNATTSILVTEYDQINDRWLIESYIQGY